jgi:tryptophan synthase beta chain
MLKDSGRARYVSVTDADAVRGFHSLSRLEGIMPALESSHAIAWVLRDGKRLAEKGPVVVCLSGRGDKDVAEIAAWAGDEEGDA